MDIESLVALGVFVGSFVTGGIFVLISKIKNRIKNKNVYNPLDTFARDIVIQDKLAELRVQLDADRVYICKFHNGGEYFDGTAIKKISRTHETCKPGVSHEFMTCQNIPTTLIPDAMEVIFGSKKAGEPVLKLTKELKPGFLRNHLVATKIKTFIKYRLLMGDRLVGYLGINYEQEIEKIDDKKLSFIKEAGGIIENIFITNPKEFSI